MSCPASLRLQMSLTADGARLTEAHRLAQLAQARTVQAQLLKVWPLLALDDIDGTREQWLSEAVALVLSGAATSAQIAARYYAAFRLAEIAEAVPMSVAEIRAAPDPVRATVALDLAGPVALKQAISRGSQTPKRDALARMVGDSQRLVLNGGRSTLASQVHTDQRGRAYARVTSGKACAFCLMLASRGAVYGKDTGDFEAHGTCACSVEPQFDAAGRYRLPESAAVAQSKWDAYRIDQENNPDRYAGIFSGTKTHGRNKGEQRSISEADLLGFRRFIEDRGPAGGTPAT